MCYYDNDPKNGTKYGKLYNWCAVNDARGLAPAGYHIPTDKGWTVLSDFSGGNDAAGKKMKMSPVTGSRKVETKGENIGWNGDNSSGFSGLPGGCRNPNGSFTTVGNTGNWWSASEHNVSSAWSRLLSYYNSRLYRHDYSKDAGKSVRCVRD